jgi:PAS domain S-box-containing protein
MSEKDLKFKKIFEGMEQAIYISDPETYEILYVNKAMRDMFSRNIIGKKCYKIFQGLNDPCSFCTNDKLFGENPISPYIWDFHNKKLDKWFHITDQSINWSGKKVRFEMAEDITKEKKLEERVKESRQQLRSIFSGLKDTVFVISDEYEILYKNQTAHDIFGDQLIGKKCYTVIKGEKKPCKECPMKKIFEENYCQFRTEELVENPVIQEAKYFDIMITPIKDFKGEKAVIGLLRDNTENRKLKKGLKKSKKKFQHLAKEMEVIFDAIPGLVFYKDTRNNFIRVNRYVADAHHASKEELEGKSLFDLYPEDEAQQYWEDDLEVIESGKSKLNIEEKWETEEGMRWVNTSKIPFVDEHGKIKGVIGISMDITDKKKYEIEIKKHRNHLNYLVKERTKKINCLYRIMELIQINRTNIEKILSSAIKIIPKGWQFPEITEAMIKIDNKVYKTHNFQESEWCISSDIKVKGMKNGFIRVCYLEKRATYDVGAFLNEELKLLKNIAELISRALTRKKAQLGMKLAQKKFKNTFEQAAVGIAHVSPKGHFLEINQRFCDIVGYECEEMLSKTFQSIIHEDDLEEDFNKIKLMLDGKIDQYSMEKRYIHRNGSIIWVNLTVSLVRDENKKPEYFIFVIEDITDKKEMEEKIRENERLYRTIAENLPNGVLHILDKDFNYIYNAGKKLEKLGLNNEMLVGKNIKEILEPQTVQKLKLKYRKSLTKNQLVSFEGSFGGRSFMVNAIPLSNKLGKPDRLLVLSVDITKRKQMEKRLKNLVKELKRSNKELEQFAYIASHDLQEPLRMVASFTQLLQKRYRDKLDADANEFIEFAVDGAKRMQALINDLLIYSRIGTRGKPFKETDMNIVLENVKSNLLHLIEANKVQITNDPLPVIIADKNQMVQLLQNLISNAIKFKREEPPKIHINGEIREDEWFFSVEDNGIGIDPKYFERIFIIFQRLHKKDEYGGTGIGLAVCKKIIERHNGEIWVESKKGKGSTFYFTIAKDIKHNNNKEEK